MRLMIGQLYNCCLTSIFGQNCQSLIEDVYSIRLTQEWDFLVFETDTKKNVQKNSKKQAKRPLVVTKIQ